MGPPFCNLGFDRSCSYSYSRLELIYFVTEPNTLSCIHFSGKQGYATSIYQTVRSKCRYQFRNINLYRLFL